MLSLYLQGDDEGNFLREHASQAIHILCEGNPRMEKHIKQLKRTVGTPDATAALKLHHTAFEA